MTAINMSKYLKLILLAAVLFTALQTAYSQPKSVGASFSYTGFGIVYEHVLKEGNSFVEVGLKADVSELLQDRAPYPGLICSFTWNIVLKEWKTSEDTVMKLFAGPGMIAGHTQDHREKPGFMFGMKGRFGVEAEFIRNISLSLSISPVIGSHISDELDHMSMRYYKNGLIYSLVPDIGIKYRF